MIVPVSANLFDPNGKPLFTFVNQDLAINDDRIKLVSNILLEHLNQNHGESVQIEIESKVGCLRVK